MDTIHQFFLAVVLFARTNVFLTYWLPVVLCIFGYLRQNQEEYKTDVANRTEYEKTLSSPNFDPNGSWRPSYTPTLTVGTVVGRIVVSLVPLVNIFKGIYFLFHIGSDIVGFFNDWLNIPLVPKRETPVQVTPTSTASVIRGVSGEKFDVALL
jgi:hypothetical protein